MQNLGEHLRGGWSSSGWFSQHSKQLQGEGHARRACLLSSTLFYCNNQNPEEPRQQTPSVPHGELPVTGSLPAVTERGMKATSTVRFLLSQGQLPGDFLWCGDRGLRKGRASAIPEKSRSACHSWSPPPCSHKGLQVTIAHIQRDLHLWEKNYLHLFRFIYIHSWILIQKEKN